MAKVEHVEYTADDKDAGMSAAELADNLRDAANSGMVLENYDVRVVAGWGGKIKSIKLVRKPDAGRMPRGYSPL